MSDRDGATQALLDRFRNSAWRHSSGPLLLESCLCDLILALEPNAPVTRIVEALPVHRNELSIIDLTNVMATIGYKARSAVVEAQDIDRRLLPCLFLPGVARHGRYTEAYVIHDIVETPSGKALSVYCARSGRSEEWGADHPRFRAAGRTYFFQPIRADEETTSTAHRAQTGRTWFNAILARFANNFWQLTFVSITLSLVSLGTPLFIMLVYDRVIAPRATEPLTYLAIGVVLSIGMEWLLRTLRSHSVSWLAARLDYVVGTTIFERLIQLPPAYVERASVAAQIARIKTFESVRDFFSGTVFMSVIEMPSVLVSIAAIAWFAGTLALVPLGIALAYLALFLIVRRSIVVAIRQAAKATSVTQQFTIETFEKLEAIRGNGLSWAWAEKYRELSGRENMLQFRLFFYASIGETLAYALTLIAAVSTLGFGVQLIWSGDISAGVLVAAMILTWRVLTPFHSLCMSVPRFEQLRNAILQINNLMDVATEAESDEVSARLPTVKGHVRFANVGLRYTREAGPIFLGLNADIKAGSIVVVSGSNGSGKSSILKMIQGLYSPLTGNVYIDGFDLRQLVQRDLRQLIGYVPQSPDFVSGTLSENLRFVKPLASDDELWRMLADVGAADEVAALPDRLETRLGHDAPTSLPASLRYRIAFARALLSDSSLLLIDEQPNSVLNTGIADLIKSLIQDSRGRRTVIFVSHRVDLMRLADRALWLRRGKIPQFAPLDQVLEQAS